MRKLTAAILLLLTFLVLTGITTAATAAPVTEIKSLPGQVDPYKTRSELLMEATNYVGVFSPEQAATVWAEGLTRRSAALQYIVMTEKLKNEYAEQLDDMNWVTGMSSPWVNSYKIENINRSDDSHAEINLIFDTFSAGIPYKSYKAKLFLIREGAFWRIERIQTDKGLNSYTFYTP